jgi:ribosomal protein L13E
MAAIKPKVLKKHGKQRCGKGFSREELKKTGLTVKDALTLKIPVDPKRKTAHEGNVKAIDSFLQDKKPALKLKKTKGKSKS